MVCWIRRISSSNSTSMGAKPQKDIIKKKCLNGKDGGHDQGIQRPLRIGKVDHEVLKALSDPEDVDTCREFELRLGKGRGIQGYNNSCYLDALLFSMFFGVNTFGTILEDSISDNTLTRTVRTILAEDVSKSLNLWPYLCPSNKIKLLRKELAKKNPRVLYDFMAIEDIVHLLFEQVLRETCMIDYGEGECSNVHILSANVNGRRRPNIQTNFDFSMTINGNLKFQSVPFPALFLGLQWHGEKLYHYLSVAPVPELNILSKMKSASCTKCNKIKAAWELFNKPRQHSQMQNKHKYLCHVCIYEVKLPNTCQFYISREFMRLRAIICYKGYHFTTFVRYSNNQHHEESYWNDVKWIYFDSLKGNMCEVKDFTEKIHKQFTSTEKPNINTWKKAFQNFPYLHFEVHTCIYEPIKFKPRT